jgi:hypothetical protein
LALQEIRKQVHPALGFLPYGQGCCSSGTSASANGPRQLLLQNIFEASSAGSGFTTDVF